LGIVIAISQQATNEKTINFTLPPNVTNPVGFKSDLHDSQPKGAGGSIRALLFFELFLALGVAGIWTLLHLNLVWK
jgi:hypothetical protein